MIVRTEKDEEPSDFWRRIFSSGAANSG
jgi:hypothetical protein